ncbi:hypothetical protein IHE61_21405 [Streptomyces sp. GKU 257-1]|nr:hypothetical protein [Streptomyces sp. GKU 257-1]
MVQTRFDKQVEETAETVAFGIGRFLAGRPLDGVKRTDATFWRSGTRVLPKVEGRVSRSSYRAGWKRLTFRVSSLAAVGAGGYQAGWVHQDATVATAQQIWANPDPPRSPRWSRPGSPPRRPPPWGPRPTSRPPASAGS